MCLFSSKFTPGLTDSMSSIKGLSPVPEESEADIHKESGEIRNTNVMCSSQTFSLSR